MTQQGPRLPSEEDLQRALCEGRPKHVVRELYTMFKNMAWKHHLREVLEMAENHHRQAREDVIADLQQISYARLRAKICGSERRAEIRSFRVYASICVGFVVREFRRKYRNKSVQIITMEDLGELQSASIEQQRERLESDANKREALRRLASSDTNTAKIARAYLSALDDGYDLPESTEKKKRKELLLRFSPGLREISSGALNTAHSRFCKELAEALANFDTGTGIRD